MTGTANLIMVNIDSPDPAALAEFYRKLLGWEVTHSTAEYAMISDGSTSVGFGLVEDYQAPEWPNPGGTKQFHFDLGVEDVDKAEELCLAAGATKPDFQPGGERWRVLVDPAGHPFCLCPTS
jgi:predicted enzyme related to lactoylglutathione lyase